MKVFLLLLGAAASALFASCESDIAPGTQVPQKFERGIRGQGSLYESDRSSVPGSPSYDPMIREQARVGN